MPEGGVGDAAAVAPNRGGECGGDFPCRKVHHWQPDAGISHHQGILLRSEAELPFIGCRTASQNNPVMNRRPSQQAASGFRRPVRVSITVPHHIHQALLSRSDQEGRSLSNLAAFLLEASLTSAEME